MTTATISHTFIYPIKGMRGIETPRNGLIIDPKLGIIGDRRYAIAKKPMETVEWQKKRNFYACVDTPECANIDLPSEEVLLEGSILHREHVDAVFARNKFLQKGYLVDTKGNFSMADTDKPYISILNLASVDALQQYMGRYINPHRFRMNAWVKGLQPFQELLWCREYAKPNRYQIHIGNMPLWIDDVCERCNAINANPTTGQYDNREIEEALDSYIKRMDYTSPQRGVRKVMGILAVPNIAGHIRVGQELHFIK